VCGWLAEGQTSHGQVESTSTRKAEARAVENATWGPNPWPLVVTGDEETDEPGRVDVGAEVGRRRRAGTHVAGKSRGEEGAANGGSKTVGSNGEELILPLIAGPWPTPLREIECL